MLKDYYILIVSGITIAGVAEWLIINQPILQSVSYVVSIFAVVIGLFIKLCRVVRNGRK